VAEFVNGINKKAPERGVFIDKYDGFERNGQINGALHEAVQFVLLVGLFHEIVF
jgi:hypothetical protein